MAETGENPKEAERLIYLLVVIAGQAILLGLLLPPSAPLWQGHLPQPQNITGADIFLLGLLVAFSGSTLFAFAWWVWIVPREVSAWYRGRAEPAPVFGVKPQLPISGPTLGPPG
jgi:hypothetical protein